jgi:hypothetical protein
MSDMGLPFDESSDAGTGGQRKKLVLLALVAVLVLVLAVFVVPKLLGGGSEPAAKAGVPAAGTKGKPKTAAKKAAKPKAVAKKPKPFNGAVAKDPFEPVWLPNAEREKAGEAAGSSSTGSTDSTGTTTAAKAEFNLVDVKGSGSSTTVTATYKGATYADLAVGDSFADDKFTVTYASGKCAHFTYGELPFALCEGQMADFVAA